MEVLKPICIMFESNMTAHLSNLNHALYIMLKPICIDCEIHLLEHHLYYILHRIIIVPVADMSIIKVPFAVKPVVCW